VTIIPLNLRNGSLCPAELFWDQWVFGKRRGASPEEMRLLMGAIIQTQLPETGRMLHPGGLEIVPGMIFNMRSWKSGYIGYVVDNQRLKWQHFWQRSGNSQLHYR
jgi:hypothetical protein